MYRTVFLIISLTHDSTMASSAVLGKPPHQAPHLYHMPFVLCHLLCTIHVSKIFKHCCAVRAFPEQSCTVKKRQLRLYHPTIVYFCILADCVV